MITFALPAPVDITEPIVNFVTMAFTELQPNWEVNAYLVHATVVLVTQSLDYVSRAKETPKAGDAKNANPDFGEMHQRDVSSVSATIKELSVMIVIEIQDIVSAENDIQEFIVRSVM